MTKERLSELASDVPFLRNTPAVVWLERRTGCLIRANALSVDGHVDSLGLTTRTPCAVCTFSVSRVCARAHVLVKKTVLAQ